MPKKYDNLLAILVMLPRKRFKWFSLMFWMVTNILLSGCNGLFKLIPTLSGLYGQKVSIVVVITCLNYNILWTHVQLTWCFKNHKKVPLGLGCGGLLGSMKDNIIWNPNSENSIQKNMDDTFNMRRSCIMLKISVLWEFWALDPT